MSEAFCKIIYIIRLVYRNNFFVQLISNKFYTNKIFCAIICIEEPDDVNNFTKSIAHILNFEFCCPYFVLFCKWRYIFLL